MAFGFRNVRKLKKKEKNIIPLLTESVESVREKSTKRMDREPRIRSRFLIEVLQTLNENMSKTKKPQIPKTRKVCIY